MPPAPAQEPYPIPVLADPKKIIGALEELRALKTFASPDAVNTTTGPQLPKYISAAFGSLDKPWKPGYLRSAYGTICCHKFKPKNQTDDIFLAQILGHKLCSDLTHRCRSGRVIRISMSRETEAF